MGYTPFTDYPGASLEESVRNTTPELLPACDETAGNHVCLTCPPPPNNPALALPFDNNMMAAGHHQTHPTHRMAWNCWTHGLEEAL